MIISDSAIRRPVVTIVAMLILVVFGLYALSKLEVDEYPDIAAPVVFVAVPYPGASPEQVERDVTDPLEEQFNAIPGVKKITSTSTDGFAQIIVEFIYSKNPDQGAQDIRDAISSQRNNLPTEMKEPIIRKFDPNDQPIVSLVLSSPTKTPAELTMLADPGITRQLQGINGVAEVRVLGNVDREISIEIRPDDLAAKGVSVAQVVQAVEAQNLSAPVGRVIGSTTEESIRLKGRLENPEDFSQVVIATRNGQVVRLGEVADVIDGHAEQRSAAYFNGKRAVGIDITRTKGVSTTRVSDAVKAAVAKIQKGLPAGVKLEVVRDAGERVRHSVSNVEEALIEGALLTVLVVFLFLNSWRSTVITGLALPVSVISAFIAVLAFGFTLNTMSLLGLSLAIGILIDDAIVVRENIVRHVEMGEDHVTASHRGTDEIGLAVAATTFSIVAVFVPVAFMGGMAGQWFKPFALTIACAVLVSLFVSFSLDPMLSAFWPDPELEEGAHRNPISRALDRFNRWFDRMADRYKGVIAWALDHRLLMAIIVTGSFIGAIVLQAWLGGAGFVPRSDRSELSVSFKTLPGSNLHYTSLKAAEIAATIRRHPEVDYTYTTIGGSETSGAGVDEGSVYVRLVPKADRAMSQSEISNRIREEVDRIGGVETSIGNGGPGGGGKQIQVEIRGNDLATLQRVAQRVEGIASRVPGAKDVDLSTRGQKPEIVIDVNRGLAGSLGVNVAEIAQSLRPAFAGVKAGDWVDPNGETRDVTVRLVSGARTSPTDLAELPLTVQR
ncbi:MAG: efflux RND transporter permease subunit, partial [Thermoanaerobaculia bacterium]